MKRGTVKQEEPLLATICCLPSFHTITLMVQLQELLIMSPAWQYMKETGLFQQTWQLCH